MNVDLDDFKLISKELSPCFHILKNRKIFLTGGTGFFGKWLLEAIRYLNSEVSLGISVTILSRDPDAFIEKFPHLCRGADVNFVKGDVRRLLANGQHFDYIIHAATDASVTLNKENPELMRDTIMTGAERIAEFAEKTGCKRVLYTSSGAAYGPQPEDMDRIPEEFVDNINFNENDAYSSAKRASEFYFAQNLCCELVIARCFAFSGPYLPLNGSYAFGNFIRDAIENKDITLHGDGSAIRSYLYSADLVIWLLKALAMGQDRSVYNVGSPEPITILTLAEKICAVTGNKVNILGKSSDKGNIYVPCTAKAEKELGVKVYTSLDEAINKTLTFHGYF